MKFIFLRFVQEKTMLKLHKEIDELQEKLITERMNIEVFIQQHNFDYFLLL